MVTYRRHQVVAHAQRRDLFGRTWSILLVVLVCVLLTSAADTVLPDGDKTTSTTAGTGTSTAAATSTTPAPGAGGIIGGLTSAIGDVTSVIGSVVSPIIPPLLSSSTTQTLTASSTSSTPSSTSTTSTSTSSTSTSTSTSSTTPSPTSTPTPTSTSAAQDQASTYLTTTNGHVSTVTATIAVEAPSTSVAHVPAKSFLQNKPLAGTVFALVGLVGLVILIALSTFAIRKTRRNKLERDAENFDAPFPDPDGYMGGAASSGFPGEKRRVEGNIGTAPVRSVSGRTANSARSGSAEGSDDGLISNAHTRSPSDGQETTSSHSHGAPMMQQLGQPITRYGQNVNGFTALPAPPGLTGAQRPQQQQMMSAQRGYGYENLQRSYTQAAYQQQPGYANGPAPPSAVYTQGKAQGQGLSVNTGMPSPWDAKSSPSPIAPLPPFAFQQHQAQGSQASSAYSGGYGYGTPPPQARSGTVPPSSPSPTRSTSSAGTGAPRAQSNGARPSESSQNTSGGAGTRPLSDVFGAANDAGEDEDAYADYAYAMGPGQQGGAPRGLHVANA